MGAPPAKPTPLRNSYWVLPGKVLAGEHPGGANREATRERLQRLIAAGVDCFIDLTEPSELRPYDPDLPVGVEYLRKPIKDHGTPAQRVHMAEILDCMHDAMQSGRCVYVHCRAGIGRTGTVIGCFLVERGLAGEAALDELNRLWQHCERSQSWASVPETPDQTDYVLEWKRRGIFDDQGGLTTTGLQPDEDDEATGGARTPWAHLLGARPQPGAGGGSRATGGTVAAGRSGGSRTDELGRAGTNEPLGATPATAPGFESGRSGGTVSGGRAAGQPDGSRTGEPDWASGADADPLFDPEALAAAGNLRVRFLGALIGLAVGDAVAAATQYRRPGSFTPVGDMLGGGPFDLPRGGWTDDTSMALCLADSLLERNGFDARDQVERYRRWQQEGYLSATGQCIGITASSARAIAMAQWRRQAFFGSHDPSLQDPEPLSRVAPAVLYFFATSGEAINQATEAARTTCQAPAVLDACRALARAVYAALSGQPKTVVLEKAVLAATAASVDASAGGATGAGGDSSARSSAGTPAAHAPHERPGTAGPNGAAAALRTSNGAPVAAPRVGSSAPAALAAAVAAFGATDNFRDAILYAANLGGDSDVVAAACGQLAGAYYTVKAIPTSWYNGLMQKELIVSYADRLLAHALVGLGG